MGLLLTGVSRTDCLLASGYTSKFACSLQTKSWKPSWAVTRILKLETITQNGKFQNDIALPYVRSHTVQISEESSFLQIAFIIAFHQNVGMTSPTPSIVRQGVLAHVESLRAGSAGLYRYAKACEPTLWASAYAALVRFLYDDLDRMDAKERTAWAEYLEAGQDEETGLWIDPVFHPSERNSPQHTDELLHWHASTFIATAIRILGGSVRYPISATHDLLKPSRMREFIESLPWEVSPWVVGNWTYDIGCLLGHDHLVTGNAANLEAMHEFFDWHDRHQDSKTGWWDLKGGFGLNHQQYGGYHTLMVYWMFHRDVPRPEAMIQSSLSLQSREGHFGGGCCSDMDVVDATVSLSRQYNILETPVRVGMERALPWILDRQAISGGFRDYPKHGRSEFGWRQCQSEEGEADPCSDYFRSFSVALISEVVPGTGFDQVPWRFHGQFGHGVRPPSLLRKTHDCC